MLLNKHVNNRKGGKEVKYIRIGLRDLVEKEFMNQVRDAGKTEEEYLTLLIVANADLNCELIQSTLENRREIGDRADD